MSGFPNRKWGTIALICLLGAAYVTVNVANAAGVLGDVAADSVKLGLIFLLCGIGFLAVRTFLDFTRTTPVFLAAMGCMLLFHVIELTEEFAAMRPIPLFGEVTLTKRAFETTLMIGTICLFLMGIYLSVSAITRTREEMDDHLHRLEESEQRNRQILDTMQDCLSIVDSQGRFMHVNAAFCRQYGYCLDELKGMPVSRLIRPDYHPELERFMEEVSGGGDCRAESVDLRKDGSSFHTEVRGAPIVLDNRPCLLAVIRDVTHRKKADAELMEYQKKLRALASELTITEERLKRSTAEHLHDDIGQLLAFLKMKVQIVHQSVSRDPRLRDELGQIRDTLTDILLKVRSLTFELSSPILSELGLGKAIRAWLEESIQDQHGIHTEFHDDGRPKPLSHELEAILFRCTKELLNNAVKHARPGSIKVYLSRWSDEVAITVVDDGQGFDPQAHAVGIDSKEFGLFSVRERLDILGGELVLESAAGQGCVATLKAPVIERPGDAAGTAENARLAR